MTKIIFTCEHAGNKINDEFMQCFTDAENDINSHKGIDFGALDLFNAFVSNGSDFSIFSETCRLLIDLNRSLQSESLFSSYTRNLPIDTKEKIIELFYLPYRDKVVEEVEKFIKDGHQIIHLSIHSFTPVLNSEKRKNDIGLLFDPSRKDEYDFCKIWKNEIEQLSNEFTVMFNYPYNGTDDGLTTYLRNLYPLNYLGIELEVNQKNSVNNRFNENIKNLLTASFSFSTKRIK